MRTFLFLIAACAFLASGGCKDDTKQVVDLAVDINNATRELNDELDKITNKATADASSDRIKKLGDKLHTLMERAAQSDAGSDAAAKAVRNKLGDEMVKEQARFQKNQIRISSNPETSFITSEILAYPETKWTDN